MTQHPEPPERRKGEREVLAAVSALTEGFDDFRKKQEGLFATAVAIQEHKTIERVDVIWETLTEMRAVWNTTKAVGARLAKFSAWGCGTLLALAAIVVAAAAAGIIHFGK